NFSASIDWGEAGGLPGDSDSITISANSTPGLYRVSARNLYSNPGPFPFSLTLYDNSTDQSTTATQTVFVAPSSISGLGKLGIVGVEAGSFSGDVATFTDSNTFASG